MFNLRSLDLNPLTVLRPFTSPALSVVPPIVLRLANQRPATHCHV
jgi:hypothetical protein